MEEEYLKTDIKWIHPYEKTKVELRVTTNRDNVYRLRVHVLEDLGDESHEHHTYNWQQGMINICHNYDAHWSPEKNRMVDVFKKDRQWIKVHLKQDDLWIFI